jgi:hypothetical protein
MGVFGKAARYSLSACALWWREGDNAVFNRIVLRLRERLGIDLMGARVRAAERSLNSISSVVSTWTVTSWIEHAKLDKTPLVSVILPTRNRSALLRRAVGSVRAQTYPDWEIVVVDDGSTDDTPAVIEQLCGELGSERLRAVRIPTAAFARRATEDWP